MTWVLSSFLILLCPGGPTPQYLFHRDMCTPHNSFLTPPPKDQAQRPKCFFWEDSWHPQLQGSGNSKELLTLSSHWDLLASASQQQNPPTAGLNIKEVIGQPHEQWPVSFLASLVTLWLHIACLIFFFFTSVNVSMLSHKNSPNFTKFYLQVTLVFCSTGVLFQNPTSWDVWKFSFNFQSKFIQDQLINGLSCVDIIVPFQLLSSLPRVCPLKVFRIKYFPGYYI